MTLPPTSDTEWVCDWCSLYGDRDAAHLHRSITGHEVRELSAGLTAAVRVERRLRSIERAASFATFARGEHVEGRGRWSYEGE